MNKLLAGKGFDPKLAILQIMELFQDELLAFDVIITLINKDNHWTMIVSNSLLAILCI